MSQSAADRLLAELRRHVDDEHVLAAIAGVPRERFVSAAQAGQAYENVALPIGSGQTISQPLVVARMLELLRVTPGDRVLDVGTGSGYHAALLAMLADHVWTIERRPELSAGARRTLADLGIENVTPVLGDGWEGLPDRAPFDAINVAAAAASPPAALLAQLAPGGRLIFPAGEARQHLVLVRRTGTGLESEQHEPVRFVPLVRDRAG